MTLAWLNASETTPAIAALFDRLQVEDAWVPTLWWVEVANALQMGVRRKRFNLSTRSRYLQQLQTLVIRTDSRTEVEAWGHALALSDRHHLTVYDAVYLELALRRDLPLATLDAELRGAATAEGLSLLGA